MANAGWVVVEDHLDELIEQMRADVAKTVRDTAEEIAAVYSATAPKDTGFMASSAYHVTHDESTYDTGVVAEGPMLPEVEKPSTDLEAIAAVAAEYAVYPEYGTVYIAARPAFHSAVDTVAPRFAARLEALESHIHLKGQ